MSIASKRVWIAVASPIILCWAGIFFSTVTIAATPSPGAGTVLTISEIFACQQSSPNDQEWVEIYNSSASEIDLTAWKIGKNTLGTASLSGTLAGNSYKKILFSHRFANDGFAVTLTEPNATEPIESFPLAYKSDKTTLEKCPTTDTLTSWIKDGENWKLTTTLTPDASNTYTALPTSTPTSSPTPTSTPSPTSSPTPTTVPTPSPTPTPGTQPTGISLVEVYACQAEGAKEWVELYNSGSNAVTLTSWKLTDDDNNDQPISSLLIPAKGYAVVEISKYARGMLTNDGDIVNLYDGAGKKVDSFEYASCQSDQTWIKNPSGWSQTASMTKGKANANASTPSPTPDASAQPLGDGDGAMGGGEVLGMQDPEQVTPTVESPTPSPSPSMSPLATIISVVSMGIGTLILLGLGGYLAWKPYLQKRVARLLKKEHV